MRNLIEYILEEYKNTAFSAKTNGARLKEYYKVEEAMVYTMINWGEWWPETRAKYDEMLEDLENMENYDTGNTSPNKQHKNEMVKRFKKFSEQIKEVGQRILNGEIDPIEGGGTGRVYFLKDDEDKCKYFAFIYTNEMLESNKFLVRCASTRYGGEIMKKMRDGSNRPTGKFSFATTVDRNNNGELNDEFNPKFCAFFETKEAAENWITIVKNRYSKLLKIKGLKGHVIDLTKEPSKKDTKFLWELSGDTLVPRKFAVGRDYTTSKKMFNDYKWFRDGGYTGSYYRNDYNDTKSRGKFEPRTETPTSDSNTMLKALPTNVFAMDIIMPWIRKYVTKQPEGRQKWDKSEYDD